MKFMLLFTFLIDDEFYFRIEFLKFYFSVESYLQYK